MVLFLVPDEDARADESCARVVASANLPERWAQAVEGLKRQIALLPAAECQAMTLSLEPAEDGIRIVAVTADGRRAKRMVRSSESLVPTALGLVMTIPDTSPPVPAAAPPILAPRLPEAPARPDGQVTVPRTLALWVGLSGGVRLMAPTPLSVLDVEARADLFFDRWLMLATLGSSLVSCLGQQGLDCDVYSDVSAGLGVGRRFRIGAPDVVVAFEPSVVVMHMEFDGTPLAEGQTVEGTAVALRFALSARLAIPVSPSWALTLTIDGGVAPSMLASPVRLGFSGAVGAGTQGPPPFPAWSGGLRIGASGALL
jgi:hypothetical protein